MYGQRHDSPNPGRLREISRFGRQHSPPSVRYGPRVDQGLRNDHVPDRLIATALRDGDPAGLEEAYQRYADRLYAYCQLLTGDDPAAADAVHDTFVIATVRAVELRDRDRFGAWLYAVARRECGLQDDRPSLPRSAPAGLATETLELGSAMRAAEVQSAVEAAAPRRADRELLDLTLRHQLGEADLAAVLDVPAAVARFRLTRAQRRLDRGLTAAGHQPEEIRAEYAALPFLAVGQGLWRRVRQTCGATVPGLLTEVGRRAGNLNALGFPSQPRATGRRTRLMWAGAGAAAVLALLATAALTAASSGAPDTTGRPPSAPPPLLAPASAGASGGSGTPSGSGPSASGSSSAPPSASPTSASPRPAAASQSPAAGAQNPGVSVSTQNQSCGVLGTTASFRAVAQVNGATAASVRVYWNDNEGTGGSQRMKPRGGGRYTADLSGVSPVSWYVVATLTDGSTIRANGGTVSC